MNNMKKEYVNIDDLMDYSSNLFEKIWWPTRRFFLDIPYNIKKIKWFWQRGTRGWADCDCWDMGYYLAKIIVPMLKHLKKNKIGYPGYGKASTSEKWDALLNEMVEAFEAAKRVIDDDYYKEVSGDSIEAIHNATREEIIKWGELSKADQKLFEKKVKIFIKWYFHLWD